MGIYKQLAFASVLTWMAPQAWAQTAAAENHAPDTQIGGYGEIHYNHYIKDPSRNQMDLRRFVMSLSHRFNDQLSFVGEMEWEHAVVSKSDDGEVEIEQAYLNYKLGDNIALKTGLFLMPFGFLNESHEPPVFYGVERNEVETRIIPSTWREGGVGLFGGTDGGLNYSLGVVTSFDVTKFDDAKAPLAASHQELQQAKAKDLALFAAINYRQPGWLVGASAFSGKATQGDADYKADNSRPSFAGINGRVTLADAHARWQEHGWDVEALYARGWIGDATQINDAIQAYNAANPSANRPVVPSEFYGWLVQAAHSFPVGTKATLSPFVRYEQFDTQARMSAGLTRDAANRDHVTTVGLSFHPIQDVVFKTDYQRYEVSQDDSRLNLGMGYMF